MKIYQGRGPFTADEQFVVLGSGNEPKARTSDGKAKLAPNGQPTYSTYTRLLERADDGEWVPARRSASINVVTPASRYGDSAISPSAYVTEGETWVTPYVDNGGRLALSITAERLVPFTVDAKEDQ